MTALWCMIFLNVLAVVGNAVSWMSCLQTKREYRRKAALLRSADRWRYLPLPPPTEDE